MDYLTIGSVLGIIIILYYIFKTYNSLVSFRMDVLRQTAHVDVHLKKKFDLIPALVEVVKGYAKHEKKTFEEVTRFRSQWAEAKTPEDKMKATNMLEGALSKLLIIQEQYPQLKANRSFLSLQKSISIIESELAFERKIYNKRVSWYNLHLEQFPSILVARLFGFQQMPFFSFK